MNRRDFSALLLSLGLGGCGLFDQKKTRLPGERIAVLGSESDVEADPKLAATPVTLPPPSVNAEWAQPGGNPAHDMGHLALPARLDRAWRTSIGDGSARYTKVMSQPVIAAGRIFTMDGGVQVSALDPASGDRVWQVDLKPDDQRGSAFGGGPCFWKNHLYVATGYAEVLALDPGDGKVVWRQSVSGPVHAPPTVADGRIFVVTVDNELNALSVDDGHKLWSHNGIPETANLLGGASPAIEGEIVIAAYTSGELFALRVENGRAVWNENLASTRSANAIAGLADIRGRPVIDRGRVFAVSHSGRMVAIDLRSGNRVWEQQISSSHSPWIAGDFVFVLSGDNELVCLTRNDGKVRWVRPLQRYEDEEEKSDPILWAGPVLGGNRLIVLSSTGEAVSVSPATGELIGHQDMSSGGYLGPVIANNALYLLTDDANLSAYR
ncbi:MAG TPA: PQQ-binding-like beta-propeller repeat protein [Stellaceae bacterium]|jgi:outer membrane protein assembly factor BamB|nr:PQQ-binding-like beta-propeller repeat protein [Stellaceae bacterium]